MSQIRAKDTNIEIMVRSRLHKDGFRFKKNDEKLPGKPDIVLKKHKAIIFIHGCFWHQHKGCPKAKKPASRKEFWEKKLERNVERDKYNVAKLKESGWRIAIVWECAIKRKSSFETVVTALEDWILSADFKITIPE